MRVSIRGLGVSLVLAAGALPAAAVDVYSGGTLTLPTLVIGNVTYSNVQLSVASILGGPAGSGPAGSVDSFDPLTGQLTVQSVSIGSNTFYNALTTVKSLNSIGSVSGADVFAGGKLTIPYVQVGSNFFRNAVVTVGNIVKVAGGMPTQPWDSYDTVAKTLSVPVVQYGGKVYTNVTVTVAGIVSVGGGAGAAQTITVSAPVPSLAPLKVGTSEAITATASSGLPVSYYVSTPSICSVVHSTPQEQYVYYAYAFNGGPANKPVAGSVILGGVPVATNVWQMNTANGTATMINGQTVSAPLGLLSNATVYPSSGQYYTPPYTNYVNGIFVWDDVFFANGSPLFDAGGLSLQAPGDAIINMGYSGGYYYIDSIEVATSGHGANLDYVYGFVVDGIVGLADGVCQITAFQNGDATHQSAPPVAITVDVGIITLP
jgi:hypothetical protein